MATIDHLISKKELEAFQIPDGVNRLPIRPLWVHRELLELIGNVLVYDDKLLGGRTADEHLEQFFIDFRCNSRIHADDLRRMMPTKEGVWSLHPPMLRVYGWVPRQHSFVAVWAEFEAATKADKTLNDRCRDRVLTFLKRHKITEIVYGDFTHAFPKTA